jgi:hypothetical protein
MSLQEITLDYLLKTLPQELIDTLVERKLASLEREYSLVDSFREVPERPTGKGVFLVIAEFYEQWCGHVWCYHNFSFEPITPSYNGSIWHHFWIPTAGLNMCLRLVEASGESVHRLRVRPSLEGVKIVVSPRDNAKGDFTTRSIDRNRQPADPQAVIRYHVPI